MEMEQDKAISAWIAALDDFRTRAEAVRRLRSLGRAAVPAIVAALREPAEGLENRRWALVRLAGMLQAEEAVPVLLDILESSPSLRGDAIRALHQITGKDLGPEPEDWLQALAPEPRPAGSASGTRLDTKIEGADDSKEFAVLREAFGGIAERVEWHAAEQYGLVRVPLPRGRKQQMIVAFNDTNEAGEPVVTIYTECGPAGPRTEHAAFRRNVTVKYGRFAIEKNDDGQPKVTMRHYLLRSRLDPEKLREVVLSMAMDADLFENDLTHADRI